MPDTPVMKAMRRARQLASASAVFATALLLLLLVDPTEAQTGDPVRRDTTIYRVPQIAVTGIRAVATVGGASAIEVRLDSLALKPAATIENVFRKIPLLHVRTNSRGESEISARGSESRQVAVLVDGVPLTLAWDARTDVSVIPATAVQDLSYVRGLSSMLYGPNVLGGVIELNVARSLAQPTSSAYSITSGFDHVGAYGGSASMSQPFVNGGNWLLRAGAGFRDSPGQPLPKGITEPMATDDEDLRLNTDAQSLDGFLSVRYNSVGGTWLSFSGSSFKAERGMAAELGVPDDDARLWRYPTVSRTLAVVSAGTGHRSSPLGGLGDLEASFGYDVGRTDIDAYTTRAYQEIGSFEDGKDHTLTLRLLGDQTLGNHADLRGSFTVSDITHDEFLPDGDARYKQRLMSVGGETDIRLIDGGTGINSLRLTLGGAYDIGKTPESGGREPLGTISEWGARAGVSMLTGGTTMLHAGVSRRGRFPALRELYSGALNRFAPNPDLKPEKLVAMEAGVTTRVGNGEAQAVAFHHQMKDAVVRTTLPDRRFFRVNRNELTSTGVELLVSQVFGAVVLSGDVTLQSVDLTDTEAGETNQPENLPEVFGSVRASLPLLAGVSVDAAMRHTGKQHCISPATGADTELDAGTRFDADLSRVFHLGAASRAFSSLETRVSMDNVGDTAIYDQCGLPQQGRLVRFSVRLF